ncbi:hypothetical protein ACJX0J_027008 [Zea mays]
MYMGNLFSGRHKYLCCMHAIMKYGGLRKNSKQKMASHIFSQKYIHISVGYMALDLVAFTNRLLEYKCENNFINALPISRRTVFFVGYRYRLLTIVGYNVMELPLTNV